MAAPRLGRLARILRGQLGTDRRIFRTVDASCNNCRGILAVSQSSAAFPEITIESRTAGPVFQTWRGFAKPAKKAKIEVAAPVSVEDLRPSMKELAVSQMEAALEALSRELSKLRTGRAGPGMLDHVMVDAHGVKSPLSHVAAVSVTDAQTLTVMPYDPSMVKGVESAILGSPLRLNPVVDGQTLTVPVPRLTKELCETMCKLVGKAGEAAKLSIRRARKDALDKLARAKSDLSKDDVRRLEKEMEELTKKYVKSMEDMCKKKESEISSL